MKRALLAGFFAFAGATPGFAADAVVADPVVEAPAVFSWTGGYIGLQAGYLWGDGEQQFLPTPNDYSNPDPDGFLGGVYVGYNYQFANNVVLGLEVDWAWTEADGTSLYFNPAGDPFGDNFVSHFDVDWTAAARVRLGYAVDRWLPYIAGGVAAARLDYVGTDAGVVFDPGAEETLTGWTIGGGAEYAFTDNLTFRGEYRYTDFGSTDFTNAFDDSELELQSHDIRLGIAYKF